MKRPREMNPRAQRNDRDLAGLCVRRRGKARHRLRGFEPEAGDRQRGGDMCEAVHKPCFFLQLQRDIERMMYNRVSLYLCVSSIDLRGVSHSALVWKYV